MAMVDKEWGGGYTPQRACDLFAGLTMYMGNSYAATVAVQFLSAGSRSAARDNRPLLLLGGAIIVGPIVMALQGVANRFRWVRALCEFLSARAMVYDQLLLPITRSGLSIQTSAQRVILASDDE